jgi:hypothetical protein
LGYGEESHLKQRLDAVMFVDRGYHVASVIRLFLKLRCQILGTHSENAGKWPFCTRGNAKDWQLPVPIERARTALFSTRKINNMECLAFCYRYGNKGIGMLHTTLSHAGVWDLITTMSPRDLPLVSHNTTIAEMVYEMTFVGAENIRASS